MNRIMVGFTENGTEIFRKVVPMQKRYSMQAASDHKAADKARAEIGERLFLVVFTGRGGEIEMRFQNGQSRAR